MYLHCLLPNMESLQGGGKPLNRGVFIEGNHHNNNKLLQLQF